MAKGKGVGAFAEGLVTGFVTGKKMKKDQELHDAQMAKFNDEKAMNDDMKAIEANVKPTQGFSVMSPDGTKIVYTDEATAKEAVNSFGEGAQMQPTFLVAGQQFESQEQAAEAAASMSTPAALSRRRAEVALRYNRPELANAHTQAYKNILETNRQDAQEQFLQAQQAGDYGAVLSTINGRLKATGAQADLVPSEDGGMTYQISRNGQVVSQTPFKSPAEFWSAMEGQIAKSPDKMWESWKLGQGLERQDRAFNETKRVNDAQLAQGDKRLAQGETSLGIQGRTADAGIRASEARIAQGNAALSQPKVVSGQDANGNVVFSTTTTPYDPKAGTFGPLGVSQPQVATGMRPTQRANSSNLNLGLGGAAPAPFGSNIDPAVLQALLDNNNARGAAPKSPQTATGQVTFPPGDPRRQPLGLSAGR